MVARDRGKVAGGGVSTKLGIGGHTDGTAVKGAGQSDSRCAVVVDYRFGSYTKRLNDMESQHVQ